MHVRFACSMQSTYFIPLLPDASTVLSFSFDHYQCKSHRDGILPLWQIQIYPAFSTMSSLHRLLDLPLFLFPFLGDYSAVIFVHSCNMICSLSFHVICSLNSIFQLRFLSEDSVSYRVLSGYGKNMSPCLFMQCSIKQFLLFFAKKHLRFKRR